MRSLLILSLSLFAADAIGASAKGGLRLPIEVRATSGDRITAWKFTAAAVGSAHFTLKDSQGTDREGTLSLEDLQATLAPILALTARSPSAAKNSNSVSECPVDQLRIEIAGARSIQRCLGEKPDADAELVMDRLATALLMRGEAKR